MLQCCWNVSVLQQKRGTSSNLFTRRTSPRQTCPGAITHERTHKQTHVKLELFTFTTEMRRGWNERVINHWEIPWCRKNILTSLLGGSLDVAQSDSAGKARRLYSYLQAVYDAKPYNQLPHAAAHRSRGSPGAFFIFIFLLSTTWLCHLLRHNLEFPTSRCAYERNTFTVFWIYSHITSMGRRAV